MSGLLPAIKSDAVAVSAPAPTHVVPAIVAALGDAAGWRYIAFFTANIRNPNTRRAYARACAAFLHWCEQRGLRLETICAFDVASCAQ